MSEFAEVRDRLTTLETQSEERWKAHDEKSVLIWSEIKNDISALFVKIDTIVGRKDDCMKEAKEHTSRVVAFALGIPSSILVVATIIWVVSRIANV